MVFRHACKMGLEGIVSKRLGSRYTSGRSPDWLKFKNPEAPAVRHFIRCPACDGWIDCRDLACVFEHEGPLPHPAQDRPQ